MESYPLPFGSWTDSKLISYLMFDDSTEIFYFFVTVKETSEVDLLLLSFVDFLENGQKLLFYCWGSWDLEVSFEKREVGLIVCVEMAVHESRMKLVKWEGEG